MSVSPSIEDKMVCRVQKKGFDSNGTDAEERFEGVERDIKGELYLSGYRWKPAGEGHATDPAEQLDDPLLTSTIWV